MKLKRIFALALCSALSVGLVTLSASADNEETGSGLKLTKTVEAVAGEDRTYNVTLEAYSTGSAFYAPAEIVLVLDESSGMSKTTTDYKPVYDLEETPLDKGTTYYINRNGSYVPVNYCSINGGLVINWDGGGYHSAGWYTGIELGENIAVHLGYHYNPMRYENDKGSESTGFFDPGYKNPVQFYESKENTQTRVDAVQTAAKQFVTSVKSEAAKLNADYKISVIGYKDDAESTGDGLKIGLTSAQTGYSDINAAIGELDTTTTAGISMDAALSLAGEQFSAGTNTQKVVVVISGMDDVTLNSANAAIRAAKNLKDNKVQVYTVGMMDNADTTVDVTSDKITWNNTDASTRVNARMQGVSSNFPNATECKSLGKKESDKYYSQAGNEGQIQNILTSIKNQFTSTDNKTTLGASAVIRDEVAQYFEVVGGVTVNTYNCTSYDGTTAQWDETTPKSIDSGSVAGQVVTYSGFDFDSYFVTKTAKDGNAVAPHGRKVVVTYQIKAKAEFLGGNEVPTQTEVSGVYADSNATSALESFTDHKANVAIPALTVTAQNKNVYLLGSVSADEMKTGVTVALNDTPLDIINLGEMGSFVTMSLSAEEQKNLTDDSTYQVTLTVSPKTPLDGGIVAKTFTSGNANINVFKPELTYSDYTVYLGGNVPDFEPQSTVWKHEDTESADVTMIGTEPKLGSYTYSKASGFTDCTDVTLKNVYIGITDVREYVTVTNTGQKFTVHVLKPTLSAEDTTIYYGKEINLSSWMNPVMWSDGNNKHNADSTGYGDKPTPNYSFNDGDAISNAKKYSPNDCKEVTATWTLGKNNETFEKTFTVHVAKPSFTTSDVTIYRGNDTDLEERVTVADEWACTGSGGGHGAAQKKSDTPKPTITYTFTEEGADESVVNKSKYVPDACTELTVTAKIGNKDNWTDIPNFTVHVLQPVFTVTTQDVWADYGTEVDLAVNCIVEDTDALTWADNAHNGITTTGATGAAPSVKTKSFVFKIGEATKENPYTVGENDVTFTVSGTYTLNNDDTTSFITVIESGKENFTVYVNKFKLTITRGWTETDPACYRQDAIFTVTQGRESFQVVIPKEQPSVTIGGLLCGQNYTVTADSGWSWRYDTSSSTSVDVSHTHKDTDGKAVISNTAPADGCEVTKAFTNTLNGKTLWLSGTDYAVNTYGGGNTKRRKSK